MIEANDAMLAKFRQGLPERTNRSQGENLNHQQKLKGYELDEK